MLAKRFGGRSAPPESPDGNSVGLEPRVAERPLWILHPFLAGAFPILSVFSHNVYELPLGELIQPLAVTLGLVLAFWLLLRVVTHDAPRAGLVTSLVVALVFGHETLHTIASLIWDNLNSFWVVGDHPVSPLLILAAEVIVVIFGARWIYRRLPRTSGLTSALNAFTLILVALPTVSLVSAKVREVGAIRREAVAPRPTGRPAWTPDIYFIVLDGYARSDVLKENYGLDNQPFLDRLERRGFFVAKKSHSNYCQTPLSLASTLNLDYLDKFLDPASRDLMVLDDLIKHNEVAQQLRSRGYQTIAFSTGFEPTDNREADVYLAPGPGHSAFQDILVGMTPLAILAETEWSDRFSESRKRTLFVFDRLPSIARIPGPTFTFAHIVSPHPPFLFGENGEDVSPRSFGPTQDLNGLTRQAFLHSPEYVRKGYRDQAAFLTKRVERVIEQILEQSSEPPVIILQSDHGAWLHYHPNDVESTEVRERFGTLNATLIPGRKYDGLSDDAASVNTFRIVLNNVFGAKMPLLESKDYFSTVLEPLKLIDVTERLHSEKERARTFYPPKVFLGLMQQF